MSRTYDDYRKEVDEYLEEGKFDFKNPFGKPRGGGRGPGGRGGRGRSGDGGKGKDGGKGQDGGKGKDGGRPDGKDGKDGKDGGRRGDGRDGRDGRRGRKGVVGTIGDFLKDRARSVHDTIKSQGTTIDHAEGQKRGHFTKGN